MKGRKRVPQGREATQELPWPRAEERPYKPTFAPGICFHLRDYPIVEGLIEGVRC